MVDFELDCKHSINTLASDRDCKLLAVGGREVLNLVGVNYEENKMFLKKHLRNVKNAPRQSPSHIDWNPKNNELFALASSIGNFSVYDVNKQIPILIEKQQNAAVNKVRWNPFSPNILISGGHDGVVKLWDINAGPNNRLIGGFNKQDSVRDVRFHPKQNHIFMTGYDNGGIEIYDDRNMDRQLISKKCAHAKTILTLDWNPEYRDLFASGSLDKEIKIWKLNKNQTEIINILKIKNQAGVQFVKWKNNSPSNIAISSFNLDSTISFFDVLNPYHPESVIRGHKDNITSFLFSQDDQYIFSAAKDGLLICHNLQNSYKPFDMCSKVAHTISNDNMYCFISGFSQTENKTVYDPQQNLVQQIEKNNQKKKMNLIKMINLDQLHSQCVEPSMFASFREELYFYCSNYKFKGEIDEIIQHNHNIALSTNKTNIAKFWKDFYLILAKTGDNDHEPKVEKSQDLERVNSPKKYQNDISSFSFSRSRDLEGCVDNQQNSKNMENKKHQKSLDGYTNDKLINYQSLFQYFEKNIMKLKQEVEEKNIIQRKSAIYIRKNKIKVYQQLCESMICDDQNELKQNQDNESQIINQSLVDTLQNIIDKGELQHAFLIYRVFKENGYNITVPEKQLKLWTQAYIEILRNNQFYIQANECIKYSNIDIIKGANKKNTKITFNVTCLKCQKQVDYDTQYQCLKCKTQVICGICNLPLNNGLVVWCQQCSHGFHLKHVKEWFLKNNYCPMGCPHKCFSVPN